MLDTELENQSVMQTVLSTASDRSKALTFNYASQALNNSFFLDSLVRSWSFRYLERYLCLAPYN